MGQATSAVTVPPSGRAAIWAEDNVIAVRDVPVPAPGPGEVLVRIRAAGICGSDLHAFHSAGPARRLPGIGPGHELAGEVAALGPGVAGPEPGTRVAVFPARVCDRCSFCRGGRAHLCPELRLAGGSYQGGMAEYYLAQAGYLYPVPEGMSWPLAALSEPCGISLHALKRAGLARGQNVLILGAGTIGLFAALIARDAGARRVGITARYPQQAEAARMLGATDVFAPAEVETRRPVAGEAWDIVVESIGGGQQTLQPAIDMAARGGTVLLLGVHTVPQTIATMRVFFHEVSIVGAFGYDHVGPRADYQESLALLDRYADAAARLVTHTYPLERAGEAFATALDKTSGAIKVTVLP
jgi:2-desacetyl-2-hydroxyethyl bacteriochlorophyllide A dehydrogenase